MGILSYILSSASSEMWPYQSSSYARAGSMHLSAAAIHKLTHAQSVSSSKGRGRNISASKVSHFPPQPTFNRLILFYSFVFCEDHVCAAGPRHFPSTFCNMHNSIYLYIIRRLDFIFPQRHTNKLKFSLKTITEEKRKQRRPCRSGSITRFTNHRKKSFLPLLMTYNCFYTLHFWQMQPSMFRDHSGILKENCLADLQSTEYIHRYTQHKKKIKAGVHIIKHKGHISASCLRAVSFAV